MPLGRSLRPCPFCGGSLQVVAYLSAACRAACVDCGTALELHGFSGVVFRPHSSPVTTVGSRR